LVNKSPFRNKKELQDFLEKKVLEYNRPSFIAKDPVSVPHRFSKKQDIEIAGLFASVFAWGNRTTIIRKSNELMNEMDNAPYDFIRNHQSTDLKRFLNFKHRTFNATDLLYFIRFLKSHYLLSDSLESAFIPNHLTEENEFIKTGLSVFYTRFFSLKDAPRRTQKHISSPEKNSTCKRLNMYLRWMVRQDSGVQHVRVREDDMSPFPNRLAGIARCVAIVGELPKAIAESPGKVVQFGELVLGERFGWE